MRAGVIFLSDVSTEAVGPAEAGRLRGGVGFAAGLGDGLDKADSSLS